MTRLTREDRQRIATDFMSRHGGRFDTGAFIAEVKKKGRSHPAFDWFEWNDASAADTFRIAQARDFIRDLRISFSVEERKFGTIVVRQVEAPLALSPLSERSAGGGYVAYDPTSVVDRGELRLQAAAALRQWAARYDAAISTAGVKAATISSIVDKLEAQELMTVAA